jgi:Transglutaminase-like superfamily
VSRFLQGLRRKLIGASSYSAAEIALVLPSIVLLGLARMAILLLPFRWYARALGGKVSQGLAARSLTPAQDAKARSIGRSVRATAAVTPWSAICLPQALAAGVLLQLHRIPHVVHFGLAPGDARPEAAPMRAHAWIVAGDRIVTGSPVLPEYRIVATFAAPPAP